jgi:hypothetical protein
MMTQTAFHAEKPIVTTDPVNGGDALIFTITPSPPRWWWRALRHHAGADPALVRPSDQEHENRIAVACPNLANLTRVIDAIDRAVSQSNSDYAAELALQRDSAAHLKTGEDERVRYLSDVRHAIDARYDGHDVVVA